MDEKRKEVIRCTLQSYIGKTLKGVEMDDNQKAAISRLSNMKKERFEQLCLDLTNEIQRRNGLSYDPPNELGSKLIMISDQKLKNLVMETLTVFYIKNTEYKNEELPEFLNNLSLLISDLKTQTENEIFLGQFEALGFYNKMYEFIDFVKRRGIHDDITNKMRKFIDEKVENDSFEFIEALTFPEAFLDAFERSEVFQREIGCKPIALEKFEKLRCEIGSVNSLDGADLDSRTKAIKRNMCEVLTILIENIAIPSKKIEYFENEITGVVQVLEEIEDEIENRKTTDLDLISSKLAKILENIVKKGTDISKSNIGDLKIQQISVENISHTISRQESFKLVLDIAKDIRKALA